MNRQAAFEVSQRLFEGLLLNNYNYKATKMAKKVNGYTEFEEAKKKEILEKLQLIKQYYYNPEHGKFHTTKADENWKFHSAYIGEQINEVVKILASFGDRLFKWFVDAVEVSIRRMCQQPEEGALEKTTDNGVGNAEKEEAENEEEEQSDDKLSRICVLARNIVKDQYNLYKSFYNKKVHEKGLKQATKEPSGKKAIANENRKSELRRKLREKYIQSFFHNIWRYALSFMLIYRGDTVIENDKSDEDDWPFAEYADPGVIYMDYAGHDATKEMQNLTYWPIKMMKLIGKYFPQQFVGDPTSKEFKGVGMSAYMMNFGGHVHVYLNKADVYNDGQIKKPHPGGGRAEGDADEGGQTNANTNGKNNGKTAKAQTQGSNGKHAGTSFILDGLADMTKDSIAKVIPKNVFAY